MFTTVFSIKKKKQSICWYSANFELGNKQDIHYCFLRGQQILKPSWLVILKICKLGTNAWMNEMSASTPIKLQ